MVIILWNPMITMLHNGDFMGFHWIIWDKIWRIWRWFMGFNGMMGLDFFVGCHQTWQLEMAQLSQKRFLAGLKLSLLLSGWWFQPLRKIWKSVGIIIPNIWKSKIHVPNHQPAGKSKDDYITSLRPPHAHSVLRRGTFWFCSAAGSKELCLSQGRLQIKYRK